MAGVRTLHKKLDFTFPESYFQLRLSLRGLQKLKLCCPQRVEPITPQMLKKIDKSLDFTIKQNACWWCPFLFFSLESLI